jgi:hypothetical protein
MVTESIFAAKYLIPLVTWCQSHHNWQKMEYFTPNY